MLRLSRCIALCLLLLLAVSISSAGVLVQGTDGSWTTSGLPYTAHFSAAGYLDSLQVNGFEFLRPSTAPTHGLFLADGENAVPFTTVSQQDDTLTLSCAQATMTLRFLPERMQVAAQNVSIADGSCVRLELGKGIARCKNPDMGSEYALPITTLNNRVRLIAPNGATLTLPGQSLAARTDRFLAKLPWLMPGGPVVSYALEISPALRLEDRLTVKPRATSDDFTYWSGDRQPFYTDLTNKTDGSLNGNLCLRVKSYLTKAVVQETRQRFTLKPGGTATLTWTLAGLEPGLYLAEVWAEKGKERGLCCAPRLVFNASALQPPKAPADFDAFWQRTLDEQAKIPLDLQMTRVKEIGKSVLYKFSFAGLLGCRCYGYLTVPRDATRKYPALLQLPSSGLHILLPLTFPKDDRVGMVIQISNVDIDLPGDQYDWRTWPSPYLVTGILDRDYYTLRFAYAATVRAAEILAARPEVQADNMLVAGHSEGGGLSLIAAALYPKFKAVVASLPGLCRLDWNFDYLNPPYFPIAASNETRPLISRTLSYYDATQFTRRITCPVWITVGLFDDVCPSIGVFCAYNALPGKKTLWVQPTGGHVVGYIYEQATKGVWP